ncbi:MAG: universal stress protein [Wenzhouxiangella sp.]
MSKPFIVIALDGSDNSQRALSAALDLAKATGRELHGLYVYPWSRETSMVFTPALQASDADVKRQRDSNAQAVFSEAETLLGNNQRFAQRHVLLGDPAEEILAFMEANPGAHLVMGRRGVSKIKAMLMGSVSDKVTRYAKGLVTVVG